MPPSNTVELRVVATDEASAVLRSISGTLTNLAGAYISFKGFEDLVKVISDAQLSLLQFQHAYDTFGENVGRTQQQLEDFATTASNTTIFSRDQILKGEAELLKYGELTGDTFDKARQVMLDMASRTGDVTEAAHRLGLVMENPVAGFRLLREVGIALTSEQRQQIQTLVEQGRSLEVANTLLDAYKDRLLDASAYTETLGGALQQVENALKEAFQGAAEGGGPAQLTDALHELRDTFKDPDVKQGLADLATGIVKGAGLAAQSISWFVEHVLVPAGTGLGEIAGAYHETFTEAADAAAAASGQPSGAAPRAAPGGYALPDSAASALRPKDYDATGGFRLPAISNQQFLQPSPLAYATPSAGYDEDAVAKILGMPSRQELAKYAAADKATMTDLEKSWADYGEKAKAISVDPLITGETRAARLAYWNQEMLKSTQTDLEQILVEDQKWTDELKRQDLTLEEHDKRLDEHRSKMLEVTRSDEENAAVALRTQLNLIAGLGGGAASGEVVQKFLTNIQSIGTQLLDPLVQARIQFQTLQATLLQQHAALTLMAADTKNTKEQTEAYAAALRMVDGYLQALPEHMRIAATQIGQAQTQLVGALQSSFSGFFANTSEGLRGFVKSFVDAFKQILAQALAMDLIDALRLGGKVGRPSSSGGFTSALIAGIGHLFGMAEGGVLPAGRIAMVGESGTEFLIPQVDTAVVPASKMGGGSGTTINYSPVTNISGSGLSAGQLSAVIAVNNRQQREELFRTMERNGLGRMRS